VSEVVVCVRRSQFVLNGRGGENGIERNREETYLQACTSLSDRSNAAGPPHDHRLGAAPDLARSESDLPSVPNYPRCFGRRLGCCT